jgi:hypothetical protein
VDYTSAPPNYADPGYTPTTQLRANTNLETASVKIINENLFVVGFGNTIQTAKVTDSGTEVYSKQLSSITSIKLLIQVPSTYSILAQSNLSQVVLTTCLEPFTDITQTIELGLNDIGQIQFFKHARLFAVSETTHNVVAIYNPTHYLCNEKLATCTIDPFEKTGCVANAVEDKGLCRCKLGYYADYFIGECNQCFNSCESCNGPTASDCTDTTVFTVTNDIESV